MAIAPPYREHPTTSQTLMEALRDIVSNDRARNAPEYALPDSLDGWTEYLRTLIGVTIDTAKLIFRTGQARVGGTPTVRGLAWPDE